MKKRICSLFLLSILLLCTPFVIISADVNIEFDTGSYHVVYIKESSNTTSCDNISTVTYDESNVEYLKSFDSYDEAVSYMDTLSYSSSKVASIIGERKDTSGEYVYKIINSQYALVDLNTTGTTQTVSNVYTSATNNKAYTYINGHGAFGGVDAAFLGYNNGTSRVNMKISGVSGWINSLLSLNGKKYNGYEIIPIVSVKSPSYYYVNGDGNLIHRLSKKITANNCYSTSINLGPAPSTLPSKNLDGEMIKYYSYDGNYFYTSIEDMLDDYKASSTDKATNAIPYYNYYMYSPIRTNSNITAADIKDYLESRGYTSKERSALVGEELTFIDAEDKYGVNAAISLATAINESGWGTSTLAKQKNNLFGHNAYDSSVMESSNAYKTVADCIYRHAYYYINTLFAETKDLSGNYFGSHLGNKNSGINVKYASDPYWGEKIASIYRSIDAFVDYKDYNSSKIGIKISDEKVPVMSETSSNSNEIYKLKSYSLNVTNIPVLIIDEVVGEEINGNNIWYKIQTDALINEDRTDVIQVSKSDTYYDRSSNYGYIHSSYITLKDENVKEIYISKEGLFGLHELSVDENKKVNITGYLAIREMNNTKDVDITYDLILQDQTSGDIYEKSLTRITDDKKIPYTIPSVDEYKNDYSWFSGEVDLSDVKQGNYSLYVRARSGQFEAKEILSNMLSINIASKFTDSNNRGYQFKTNYYLKTIPIELFIRDDGLISDKNTPTSDNMFNQYQDIELKDGKLNISGSSFNVGGNYSKQIEVSRKIIFENIKTFERYEYDLGYIDNGEYAITLVVPDNLDKTRAWFKNSIDLSELPKGTYSINIKTESNISDYGELNDVFLREISSTTSSGDKKYSIKVNKNQRFRLELEVE